MSTISKKTLGTMVSEQPKEAHRIIAAALAENSHNLQGTADAIGVSKVTLWRWIGRLNQALEGSGKPALETGRETMFDVNAAHIEKLVLRSAGLTVSEVAARVGVPHVKVRIVLDRLVGEKRIARGGKRPWICFAATKRLAADAYRARRSGQPGLPSRKREVT